MKKTKTGRPPSITNADNKLLAKLFPITANKVLAVRLGLTESALRSRAAKLGLSKEKHYWEQWQTDFVLKEYGKISNADIADYVQKTKYAVINKYRELKGLR